jgi:hypothetical protein
VTAQAICIDPAKVRDVWPKVSALIRKAIIRGDISSFACVEDAVLDGDALLWLAQDGKEILAAVVTLLEQTETKKVCTIVACGGTNMGQWLPLIEKIEAFAAAEKCAAVRIFGREGWGAVLPSYQPTRVMLERTLEDGR